MKKLLKAFFVLVVYTVIAGGSCDLFSTGGSDTPGVGNYGILTVSDRSDLVPDGWMPAGDMVFEVRNHYDNNSSAIELGLGVSNNTTSIVVGLGKSYSCVTDGSFCVVSPTTGHPAISITIVGLNGIGQYRAAGGTVFNESLDPLVVRFERVYMTPESYDGNQASGSFYLDGTLYAQQL